MTPRPTHRTTRRRSGEGLQRSMVLDIPLPMVIVALVATAALGLQLAVALEQSTSGGGRSVTSVDASGASGMNSAGLPVVTETGIGPEVQRLIDSGVMQPATSFDAGLCLTEQGIGDSILIMEEVAWSADGTRAWLLVHGPVDRETLRANGGTVSATVVLPSCGTQDGADPSTTRLWTGDVMIGSL